MRKTGRFIILGITIAVTLYVFAGIIYFRPQTWDAALVVTPVAQAPAQVPSPAPKPADVVGPPAPVPAPVVKPAEVAVPTPVPAPVPAPAVKPAEVVVPTPAPAPMPTPVEEVVPAVEPTPTEDTTLILAEQEQNVILDRDLTSVGTSALDPLSLNRPLGDLKDLSGVKDAATSLEESIALAEEQAKKTTPATAPLVTMTVKPVIVPVVEVPAPILEPIAPVAEALPVEEPIVIKESVAEAKVVSEPEKVAEPAAVPSVVATPVPPAEPAAPVVTTPVPPMEPAAPVVIVPGPPKVSFSIRPVVPPPVQELQLLWTPTVMPEGPVVHVDPVSYSQQAFELRKKAVDQILDNLSWE
ncbi:MAG: hypothetical protein CVV52_00735 [Spirochaetae bacterium HGW-Spirochaetae-8]|jgi:hypothetical protein|nr:MAG: hypothetical protein CVV52_00735 [Spirochaetae bacterium HGW-Spirochaetae-8]